jgi:predicted small secreted protein
MKQFLIVLIFASLTALSGCNTVKGTADGFNKDMNSLTGHSTTSHTNTTYHSTNNS